MNDWQQMMTTTLVPCVREGWRGVWDALVAAIKGNPRLTIATPVTYSVYVKTQGEVKIEGSCIYHQVEAQP